jgi:hypothetical protein
VQGLTADAQRGVEALVGSGGQPSRDTDIACTRNFGTGDLLGSRGADRRGSAHSSAQASAPGGRAAGRPEESGGERGGLPLPASVRRVRAVSVLLVLAWTLLACGPVAPADPPGRSPVASSSLEPTTCPVPVRDGTRLECGWLTVPESRRRPDGRSIRLLVAVAPSPTPPSLPPLLVTAGGPGTSSTGLLGLAGSGYAEGRDLVVLEQRGTGPSSRT